MTNPIYVTGTGFSGKTALCLGLYEKFQEKGLKVGYFKPVAQGQKMVDGRLQDPDVILMKEVMGLSEPLDLLSPVVFGDRYLDQLEKDGVEIYEKIFEAYHKVSQDKDLLLIESASLPEFLASCNLDVSRLSKDFEAKVIFTVKGDEDHVVEKAILYKCFIERTGGEMLGVVLNHVPFHQIERMRRVVSSILERNNLDVLGVVPDHRELTQPTVRELVEILDAEVLTGNEGIDALVDGYLVGAMTPESAMTWLRRSVGRALITGGDRTDLVLMALETGPSAIILTGNIYPPVRVLNTAEDKGIPVLLVTSDTYTTVTKLEFLEGKIFPSPASTRKIQLTRQIIGKHLDLKKILDDYLCCKS